MKKLFLSTLAILLCLSAFVLIACNGDDSTTTANKTVPTFEIINPAGLKTSVKFEIKETDPDGVGEIKSIELYCGRVKVQTANDTSIRTFSDLYAETTYTVKVTYVYDIQNGEGEKTDSVSLDIKTTNGFSSKTNIKTDWSGKTLNIACSIWHSEPSAPWSVLELCVDYGKESGFGTKIDAAVLERQEFIKETYGVDLNWINATRYGMHDVLEEAIISGNVYYDLALPRAMRVQSIVANGSVYDLKDRQYIDFDNSFYNKDSVETYTAKGHTFFVDGDFSILGKETAYVLYFNKILLGGEQATKDLYQKVRENKWTYDDLVALASAAYKDDGDGIKEQDDIYGLNNDYSLELLFQCFGVKNAQANKETGEWTATFKNSKTNDIVEIIASVSSASYARGMWITGYGMNDYATALTNATMLFYNSYIGDFQLKAFENIGVVPFPMLNADQGRYFVFTDSSAKMVLMCIPKNTQDRSMSEYFLDVLSWTGKEYTMKAYLDQKADEFETDVEIEMLTDYVFPNIIYDAGVAVDWGDLFSSVENYAKYGVERFTEKYNEAEPGALETLAKWNTAWGAYKES